MSDKNKLHQYIYHSNQGRRHGGINYLTPTQKLLKLELEDLKDQNSSQLKVEQLMKH